MEDIFIEQIWKQIMEKGLDCISKLDMLDFQSIKNIINMFRNSSKKKITIKLNE